MLVALQHQVNAAEGDFRFVTSGLENRIDSLRQATVEIVGQNHSDSPVEKTVESPLHIFVAVDGVRHLFRFDRTEPKQIFQGNPPVPQLISTTASYCRLTDCSLVLNGYPANSLEIRSLTAELPHRLHQFDPRLISVMLYSDMEESSDRQLLSRYISGADVDTRDEKDGIYTLTWSYSGGNRRTIWIDSTRGFIPIRHEIAIADKENDPWVQSVTTSDWKKIGEDWVPGTRKVGETAQGFQRQEKGQESCRRSDGLVFVRACLESRKRRYTWQSVFSGGTKSTAWYRSVRYTRTTTTSR